MVAVDETISMDEIAGTISMDEIAGTISMDEVVGTIAMDAICANAVAWSNATARSGFGDDPCSTKGTGS